MPERDKGVFDPKSVVANSGRPRQTARERHEKDKHAAMARAALAFAPLPKGVELDSKVINAHLKAVGLRMRDLFGRGWWKKRFFGRRGGADVNGAREIARRKRQIEQGKLHPYVIAHWEPFGGPAVVRNAYSPLERLPYPAMYPAGEPFIVNVTLKAAGEELSRAGETMASVAQDRIR